MSKIVTINGKEFTTLELQTIAKRHSMRYVIRDNEFKSSNLHFEANSLKAYSYGWWCFFRQIDDEFYFNNYGYSNSTCKHQRKMWSLLRDLGFSFHVLYDHETLCVSTKHTYLVKLYKHTMNLQRTINAKGTRKTTNARRRKYIESYKQEIEKFKQLGFTVNYSQIHREFRNIQNAYKRKLERQAEKRAIRREKNRINRSGLGKLIGVKRELPLVKDMEILNV